MASKRKRELSSKTCEQIGRAAFRLMQRRQSGKSVDREALLRSVPADAREEANKALELGDLLVEVFGPSKAKGRRKR